MDAYFVFWGQKWPGILLVKLSGYNYRPNYVKKTI
jgi:hypothetical protein